MVENLSLAWQGWKWVGQTLGDWVARSMMTLFYFTLFSPFAIGVRWWGDPLGMKGQDAPRWLDREIGDRNLEESRRQF